MRFERLRYAKALPHPRDLITQIQDLFHFRVPMTLSFVWGHARDHMIVLTEQSPFPVRALPQCMDEQRAVTRLKIFKPTF